MQPLTRPEIESVDGAGDGCGRGGAQRLFHRPEGFFFVSRLDQDQSRGIETKRAHTVAVRRAATGEGTRRKNEQDRPGRRAAEEGGGEAESGGHIFIGLGRDLVQRAVEKAALQMRIEGRKAKRKETPRHRALQPRQEPAQFLGNFRAMAAVFAGDRMGDGETRHGPENSWR